jgi:peroxiredoxin (alkyl hydroperoxide reductase subunit C)
MDYEIMMNGNVKIGQIAPDFEAETTMGKVKLLDYKGKWVVFFSHPGNFTLYNKFIDKNIVTV